MIGDNVTENELICEAMDRVEWEFSKIKSEKKLKKAVKLLEKAVKKILIDVEAMHPQVVDLPQANSDVCGEEGAMRAFQRTIDENDELMRRLADS